MTQRVSSRLLIAGALAATVLVAGCGGKAKPSAEPEEKHTDSSATTGPAVATPSQGGGNAGKACALVSLEEANAITGASLQPGVEIVDPDRATCTYRTDAGPDFASLEIYFGPGANKGLEIDLEFGNSYEDIDGIGDEAHAGQHAIYFRMGDNWIGLHATRPGIPEDPDPALIELARKVVTRV